jgi:hypothetical protein
MRGAERYEKRDRDRMISLYILNYFFLLLLLSFFFLSFVIFILLSFIFRLLFLFVLPLLSFSLEAIQQILEGTHKCDCSPPISMKPVMAYDGLLLKTLFVQFWLVISSQ